MPFCRLTSINETDSTIQERLISISKPMKPVLYFIKVYTQITHFILIFPTSSRSLLAQEIFHSFIRSVFLFNTARMVKWSELSVELNHVFTRPIAEKECSATTELAGSTRIISSK